MGSYDLQKRLSALRSQAEGKGKGQVRSFRTFVLAFFAIAVVSLIFSNDDFYRAYLNIPRERAAKASEAEVWRDLVRAKAEARADSLSGFTFGSGIASGYKRFADSLTLNFAPTTGQGSPEDLIDFESWTNTWYGAFSSTLLRIGLVSLFFWPLWILGGAVGFFAIPKYLKPKRSEDVLGVCDRGNGPFYSGIYGPLRPNNSVSCSDFSCPGLACPEMAPKQIADVHPLTKTLRDYGALNETNAALVRIIVAYKDFPCVVDEERSADERDNSEELLMSDDIEEAIPTGGIITNEAGTLENSATGGLRAILETHQSLLQLAKSNRAGSTAKEGASSASETQAAFKKLSPAAQLLFASLTAQRRSAIAKLPSALVASAYLATEAGKSMVFKRIAKGYAQISRFPHLQARAVLQSLVHYHSEYNGDARMVVRQAIICSRRHGDFGRAFLPTKMPIASRALRDWLEIMYAPVQKRSDAARLAELDSHLDELSTNWRANLSERLKMDFRAKKGGVFSGHYNLWKGLVFKSVVLVPLRDVLDIALTGIGPARQKRVSELMRHTRKLQGGLSVSARLPGFKRQTVDAELSLMEAANMPAALAGEPDGSELLEKWLIIRRMLTRYNWLSTRVGDFTVPDDGLIQAVFIDRTASDRNSVGKPNVCGLDCVVPIRQRRMREQLGPNWERTFYEESPHPNDVLIYVSKEEFDIGLKQKQEEAAKGLLNSAPQEMGLLGQAAAGNGGSTVV